MFEGETDPARMLDMLAEVRLIHRVRPVEAEGSDDPPGWPADFVGAGR